MTVAKLLQRSLLHHWRTNLAVVLGSAVGTAVLTGALLVGDSLRGSLRDLTLDRLGKVEYALVAERFFREPLAEELESLGEPGEPDIGCCPAILLRGTVSHGETSRRATRVNVIGVTEEFWRLWPTAPPESPEARQVLINEPLAKELGAGPGDPILIRVEKQSPIPRDWALGRRTETVGGARLEVRAIIPAEGPGRFGLETTQLMPRNVYVPLSTLQRMVEQPDGVNAILVSGRGPVSGLDRESLPRYLKHALKLDDLGILVRPLSEPDTVSVETRSLVMEPAIERLVLGVGKERGLAAWPILTHLANTISVTVDGKTAEIPYSTITALDLPPSAEFGQFRPVLGDEAPTLDEKGLFLNEWAAWNLSDGLGGIPLVTGTYITLSYYYPLVDLLPWARLLSGCQSFKLQGVLAMTGPAADPGMSPSYPGITDADSILAWKPPFPVDLSRIRPVDEEYWEQHKATPKAFIALGTGQKLWGSRFGRLTSIRLASTKGGLLPDQVAQWLPKAANPEDFGLVFEPVRETALAASSGSTDFGQLFVAFSMFLIASAAILVGLLFQLGLERRSDEVGLLLASGFPLRTVRRLFFREGMVLAGLGGVLGLAGAAVYAWLMIEGLRTWWVGAVGSAFLRLHVSWLSLGTGLAASVAIVLFAIWRTVRRLGSVPVRALLAGGGPEREMPGAGPARSRGRIAGVVCVVLALVLMVAAVSGMVEETVPFFGSGALLLVASLAFLSASLRGESGAMVRGHGIRAVLRLGIRNGARHPGRSVLTAGLVACASFVIVAVAANRANPSHQQPRFDSGDGGFALMAESDLPIYHDLNSEAGRKEIGLSERQQALLKGVKIFPLRVRPGDDSSCLNLYRPREPRILGVPNKLIFRGGFGFEGGLPDECRRGCKLCREVPEPGVVPVFGDANTLQWILHLGIGDDLPIRAETGEEVRLRIAGRLKRSIFQGELLMWEPHFHRLFPSRSGYQVFLIETPPDRDASEVAAALEEGLAEYGFDAVRTADKLAEYLAVQNTYLSTFLTIGGLGLLLGTLGLGTVLLRNVLERRAELAMLRALGFRSRSLAVLVLAENGFLLVLGLLSGTVSALLAVSPHLLSGGADVPWVSLLLTLAAVLVVGMASGLAAAVSALRGPLLPALRGE